ncbi:pseudouridine synthase [Eubacteriales bacterium OttesenSCG-928-N13]|nr:pseudouridine synthase [Eubacteriales bacterium OttesenSCG-928-N13]
MEQGASGVRLNKFLADSGFCSRREADRLITDGRVTIDGRIGVLGDKVQAGSDVRVDGQRLSGESEKIYIALNKPLGIVCTADAREPMNVIDYVRHPQRIFPIGRLDKDSTGLLLLTSDGGIVNRMLRAAGHHEKEYIVSVDRRLTPQFLEKMAAGVPILDTVTLPCKIERISDFSFRLTLTQGLNRQIRRMCMVLGYNVVTLKRVRIMNIQLGTLEPGHWRDLTESELSALFSMLSDES